MNIFSFLILALSGLSCEGFEAPGDLPVYTASLTVADVEVTDVSLVIKVTGTIFSPVFLLRDGKQVLGLHPPPIDTTIIDGSLLPLSKHQYQLYTAGSSPILAVASITTMDTTTHEMEWHVDTLGDGGPESVSDIAILSDSLIYTVGDIYTKDSASQLDTVPWNAAVWNGTNWRLLAVPVQLPAQPPLRPGYCKCALQGVIGFSPTDVWMTVYNELIQWNGSRVSDYSYVPNSSIQYLWAESGKNVYGAGQLGEIAHFDGSHWAQLMSGTTTQVRDIWGNGNYASSGQTVLCAVSEFDGSGERKILKVAQNESVYELPWTPRRVVSTIWFSSHHTIFVGGGGLYTGDFVDGWREVRDLPLYFSERVRGTDINDVFVVGDFCLCGHFNGRTWKNYSEFSPRNGSFESLVVTRSMCVAGGFVDGKAVVLRGYRR